MTTVWIDAGHGGKDPGAVGNGLKEKDITLRISLAMKQQLEAQYADVKVLLTRTTDADVTLKERTNKANQAGANILISVHCNAGGGAGGFESFRYTSASAASKSLQDVLHNAIMTELKPYNVTDRGQKTKNLHMLRESKMPAVLTENLFIDVANDASKLKQQEVIEAIVKGHVNGIAQFLSLKPKGDIQPDPADPGKTKNWKENGREWLIANAGISPEWKATDPIDIGTLGTILSRMQK
ncbi:N-acetylmuramoyl-L-alanine amidase [Paenibacillus lentus]|uniref:N-acetylmuramoyl-L-alanine amidase n=1 Tax=Paenibacillus lentus TaxID=1338368 RepID=A0A3Q8S4W3_9BACL|nr:N-acetylmuramoyl-L-alanine amidase [Paenibacillus lentus]AZK46701.1 N-acetylmuramoyl-L-alanine amidase [Paenibacillus lentus]